MRKNHSFEKVLRELPFHSIRLQLHPSIVIPLMFRKGRGFAELLAVDELLEDIPAEKGRAALFVFLYGTAVREVKGCIFLVCR
jgi:hypothetical protein